MTRHVIYTVACACLVFSGVPEVNAEDNVLQAIPDSALAVGYVKGLEHVNQQMTKLARLVSPDAPELLEAAMSASGIREGVNKKGMMAVAVLPRTEAAPAVVLLLPTSDYAAFVRQFNPDEPTARIVVASISDNPVAIGRKGSFAVVARSKDRSLVEAVLDSQHAIQNQVKPLQAFLDDGDASFVLTERGVKSGMRQALDALRSVKTEITQASDQGEAIAAAFGIYESIFEAIQDNVVQAAVVARVESDGTLRLGSRTMLRADSKLAGLAKTPDVPGSNYLRGLPPGPFVFAFAGETPEAWAEDMMRWSLQIGQEMGLGKKVPQEKMDNLVEAGALTMKGVRGMGMSMNVGKNDEPLYGRMYLVVHTDDAKAYLDRYEAMVKTMAELAADGSIPLYDDMDVKQIRVAGTTGLKISMGFDSFPGAEKDENLKALYRKMFGGERMQVFVAAADDTMVVGAYTSKKQLASALRAVKSADGGLSVDSQLITTAKLLEDAQWFAYFSPAGGVEFVKKTMALFAPEATGPLLPEFPKSPPFGFAVKISGQMVHTDLVVPAATLSAIGQFAKDIREHSELQKLEQRREAELGTP